MQTLDFLFNNLILHNEQETIIHLLYLHWAGGPETHSAGWLLRRRHIVHTHTYIPMRTTELLPDMHVFGNVEENYVNSGKAPREVFFVV